MKRKIFLKPIHYFFFCLILILVSCSIIPQANLIVAPWNLLGIILIVLGIYFFLSTIYLFKKHKTPISFEKSDHLITEGVFKYTSNPMYFGGFVFLLGSSFLFGNLISFISPILFYLVIDFMFIPFEEEKLELEFGQDYLSYKKKTKKWI